MNASPNTINSFSRDLETCNWRHVVEMFERASMDHDLNDKQEELVFIMMNELAFRGRLNKTDFWKAYRHHITTS